MLWTRNGDRQLRVYSEPVDGSAPAVIALRLAHREFEDDMVRLAGSAQRVAAVVEAAYFGSDIDQVFTGPQRGPLTALGAPVDVTRDETYFILHPLVDGDRWVVVESDQNFARFRTTLREGDGPPVDLALPGMALGLAGDLVVYVTDDDDVVIRNWRTGAERSVAAPKDLSSLDLRADGAIVVSSQTDGTRLISPNGASRRLSRTWSDARFAGDRVVYEEDDGLMVAEPDGRSRALGPRTGSLVGFDADERHVAWSANGCVLAASVTEPASAAPPAGPCVRSEVGRDVPDTTLRRDRTVPVKLRCYAAVRACRGTLRLSVRSRRGRKLGSSATVRFTIPVGKQRRLLPRLGPTMARRVRQSGWGKQVPFRGHVVTVDPDGRRTMSTAGVFTTVRSARRDARSNPDPLTVGVNVVTTDPHGRTHILDSALSGTVR